MRRLIVALLFASAYDGQTTAAQSPVERALLEAMRSEPRTTCSGTVLVPEASGDERMAVRVPTAESTMPRIIADCLPARRIVLPSSQARSSALPPDAPVDVPRRTPPSNGGVAPIPR